MTRSTNAIHLAIAMAAIATANAQSIHTQVSVQPAITIVASTMAEGGQSSKDNLFAGTEKFAQGANRVTEINLDPSTMSMMGGRKGKDADLAQKMTLMTVHTYSYDKPGMYRMEDVDAFRKKLEDGSWNCYVHTRSESGSSDICARAAADHETNEMVIITTRPEKLTFIHMSGKMSLNELSEMSGSTNGIGPHEFFVAPMAPMAPMPPMRFMSPSGHKDLPAPPSPAAPTPPTPPTSLN